MIDIEKFICSLLADHPAGITVRSDIHKALKEQGLEYKDGKIVPIGDERIRKALITAVSGTLKGNTLWHTDVTREEALAWLEKQSEQKQDPCEHCKDKCLNCHNFPCIDKRTFEQGKSALEAIK